MVMKKLMLWCADNIKLLALASLTLGLAPFQPEPHIWQKLKWLLDGANGYQPIDWFDLFLHGTPWVLLLLGLGVKLLAYAKKEKKQN